MTTKDKLVNYHQSRAGFTVPVWLQITGIVFTLLLLLGVVGHMDFMDEIRASYASSCPHGTISVDGSRVTCAIGEEEPFLIGVLK